MKLIERAQTIGRKIADELLFRNSNPEHIRAFPAHLSTCSLTKPLQTTFETKGPLPNWSNLGIGFEIVSITITCTGCGGSFVKKCT